MQKTTDGARHNTVVRSNDEWRIYVMTFIDHSSRTVWNSSQLDKNLAATVFNEWRKSRQLSNVMMLTNQIPTHYC